MERVVTNMVEFEFKIEFKFELELEFEFGQDVE
jgi:hypothetical protein